LRQKEGEIFESLKIMGFLRSEDMYLYKLIVAKDNAYQCVRSLGKINAAHFINVNKYEQPFKLTYVDIVKRCEEAERRLL
jgi:disulfide oxidoreductase YuzD